MKKAILGTKVGMTQIFGDDGVLVPVTVLQAGPCYVTQIKTVENDGYSAVQVGFVDKKEKIVTKDASGKKEIRNRHGVTKAEKGHFAKAGVTSSAKDMSGSLNLTTRLITNWQMKSKQISFPQAIKLTLLQLQRVKVSRARLRGSASTGGR